MVSDWSRRTLFIFASALVIFSQGGCRFCLVEGTSVATPSGATRVENLRVGDEVISMSPGGEKAIGRVYAMRLGRVPSYLEIKVEGIARAVAVTADHPLATPGGWRLARSVSVGDQVQTEFGPRRVFAVTLRHSPARVFDIGVKPYENLYANDVLVHNKSIAAPAKPADLVGAWVGRIPDLWGTVYRLEVSPDGAGFLACRGGTGPAQIRLYRVSQWTLKDGDFNCVLHQVAPKSPQVSLRVRGRAFPLCLRLELSEEVSPGRWEQFPDLRMQPEKDFYADLDQQRDWARELAERMYRYRSRKEWNGP